MAMIDYGCVVFKNGKQIRGDELFPALKIGPYVFTFYKWWCEIRSSAGLIGAYWGANRWCDSHYGEPPRPLWRGAKERPVRYPDLSCRERGRISVRDNYPAGLQIHIKALDDKNVFRFQTSFEGDRYTVYYGYGVDPNPEVWNRIKVLYLGKKLSAKLDRLIARSGGYASGEMFSEG